MEIKELAEMLKALGDPTRLKMIALLAKRDCCVCELVPLFGISQPAVSRHLSRLKTAGLVTEQRRGQWVFYSLNRARLQEIGDSLNRLPDLETEWTQALEKGVGVFCDTE